MLVSKDVKDSVQVAVKNWVECKCDLGEYITELCCQYTGGGHPIYVAELLNVAFNEVRASALAESTETSHNIGCVQ